MGLPSPAGSHAGLPVRAGEGSADQIRVRAYFRRLRRRLRGGLAVAFVLPLILLTAYFHYQFNLTVAASDRLHLVALAESQRNTIDLYLQERVVNLFSLFRSAEFTFPPSPELVARYLAELQESADAFVDLGFFGTDGVQIGYAGPHAHLRGRDYSGEGWFQALTGSAQAHHITDIYLGFRHRAHFGIAVKQPIAGRVVIVRATVDPRKFYDFLHGLAPEQGVDSVLVNARGEFQVVAPDRGRLLEPSGFAPPADERYGTADLPTEHGTQRVAFVRLNAAPWVLVVRQRLGAAHADVHRVQRITMIGTVSLLAVVLAIVWLATGRLLRRAQQTEESRVALEGELIHAGKLAAAGELAAGVAHEINNPLAVIGAESGLIRDRLDPRFDLDASPDRIREQLDQIDAAILRAKTITQKLLSLVRRDEPRRVPVNVNTLLDEIVSGLKGKQFEVANIAVRRDFAPDMPEVLFDPDQMRQVLLNLINNAGDAIGEQGEITLRTRHDAAWIRVTVADTGCGMTPEEVERVFLPFYTTKEVGKGTGLGLSVSWHIVELMGGRIEVTSEPDAGSAFTVRIPADRVEDTLDGR